MIIMLLRLYQSITDFFSYFWSWYILTSKLVKNTMQCPGTADVIIAMKPCNQGHKYYILFLE